jgi:hypothetical protein
MVRDPSLNAIRSGIQRHLEQHWSRYYPARGEGAPPRISCISRGVGRGFSVTLKYALDFAGAAERQVVFVKLRRESRDGNYQLSEITERAFELARIEFEQLSRAHEYFNGHPDGLGVVRPLDYLAEYNAVLIERARGRDLGLILGGRRPASGAAVRRCGAWLREFHAGVQQSTWHPWESAGYEAAVLRRQQILESIGVPAQVLDRVCRPFLEHSRAQQGNSVPRAVLHGDYKARHVWATDDAIQVLDFGNVNKDDCYVDVAAFVVELAVMALWRPWIDARQIDDWTDTFLRAYFAGEPPSIVRLHIADALLKKWHRRLVSWSWGVQPVRMLHRALSAVGAAQYLERQYVDRWFAARLNHWAPVPGARR